jgi:hypothetical protein
MSAITFHYDPRLLEEAVFLAERAGHNAPGLRRERDRIYETVDDERERRFADLYRSWFNRLELGKVIERAVQEQPAIASLPGSCFVVYAARAKEEGAELFVDSEGAGESRRTLRILVRPASLLNGESLLTFLRHELLHIADMLDPHFAYEPDLPASESGPTYDALLRSRYKVLWDTAINGRMVNRGWLPPSARGEQLAEFTVTFPMLEQATEPIFDAFFSIERHSHRQFVAFAQDPRAALGSAPRALSREAAVRFAAFPPTASNSTRNSWTILPLLKSSTIFRTGILSMAFAFSVRIFIAPDVFRWPRPNCFRAAATPASVTDGARRAGALRKVRHYAHTR